MRKKHLLRTVLCIVIAAFSFSSNIEAQQSALFTKESTPESNFQQIKVSLEGTDVIFRSDRIEFFNKKAIGQEEIFYLVFEDSELESLEAQEIVKETKKSISNPAMAKVLGVNELSLTSFEKLVYKNLYDQTDLIVFIQGDKLKFTIETALNENPVKLAPWGQDFSFLEEKAVLSIENFSKDININSEMASLSLDQSSKLELENTNKSLTEDLTFTISLK